MDTHLLEPKIRAAHLGKLAFIYVRQSSLKQVQRNVGSTARQYDLALRARELGWQAEQIVVVNQSQARSGSSSVHRTGFQHLVAEVGLGHAGAVLSLEASRLARASSDWYRLLEICALTETLVIDEEGIYDPCQYNDRLLLGFKGTMSEAELHWLRSRLEGGKLELARQGKLRFHPPTGFVHDADGQLILDPDQAVQAAIQQVFDCFAEYGTARGVVLYFRTHQLQIPTRLWGTARAGECVWRPLSTSRVLGMLHNPFYAGTYVYGQTQTVPRPPGEGRSLTKQILRPDWPIMLPQHHVGYLSWEQYQANQHQLADNVHHASISARGAVREGGGLLQGIVLCGRCGRRMKMRYQEDGIRPTYVCDGQYQSHGDTWCQAIRGQHVDAAIAQLVLTTMQPAEVEVALAALEHLEQREEQRQRQQHLLVERAQYEADVARRRFMQVEPENRLVARTLERDWNEKLTAVEQLRRQYSQQNTIASKLPSEAERQQILQLVQAFPLLWQASTTTHAERKQLVRYLIRDVTLFGLETTIRMGIRWHTGAVTEQVISRGTQRTAQTIIAFIRQAVQEQQSDAQIAQALNGRGWRTARCHAFTPERVKELRSLYHLPRGDSQSPARYPSGQRADGMYTVRRASELLNWSISTIHKWCRRGILKSTQKVPGSPVWVKLTPEKIAQLRNPHNPWDPSIL